MTFNFLKYLAQKVRVRRWKRDLHLHEHQKIFQSLYKDVDGYSLSRIARAKYDIFDYVYGEIEFIPFLALLSLVKINQETVLYDLGSGTGKAVIAAAMVYPLKKAVGVELLEELYGCACSVQNKLLSLNSYSESASRVEFILGDFLQVDLMDATVIFINSSAILDPTWSSLCARFDQIPNLRAIISTSKPVNSKKFSVQITSKIQMSWGVVKAYIQVPDRNSTLAT